MLKVTLLGTPQLQYNGNSLNGIITGRNLALFVYLALAKQPQERGHLADLLWTDISEQEARQNLRGVLYSLRKLLGDYLIVTRDTIAFDYQQPHWLDSQVFSTCLNNTQTQNDLVLLQNVLQLYQGEFLADFYIQNAPGYEAWLVQQREQFHNHYIQASLHLSQRYLDQGNYTLGINHTRRVLQLEPWQEEAHRMQMSLLAYNGQRLEALTQYSTCRQILQKEYGVEPEWATTQLFQAIEAGKFNSTQPKNHKKENKTLQANWDAIPQNTLLVGRDAELEQLYTWIAHDHRRVIGLFGLAGQGKSALAVELVMRLQESFLDDGGHKAPIEAVVWSSLATIPSLIHLLHLWSEQIAQFGGSKSPQLHSLSSTLELSTLQKSTTPIETCLLRLLTQLRHHRVLLVLDTGEALFARHGETTTYHEAWEGFDEVLRRLAENEHNSHLLFVSQITPVGWDSLARRCSAVRATTLSGLTIEAGTALLQANGGALLSAPWHTLVECCVGHPQTLVATRDLLLNFDRELFISAHLEETVLVGTLFRTLQGYFASFTAVEQSILINLALTTTPQTIVDLRQCRLDSTSTLTLLEALQTLQRHLFLSTDWSSNSLALSPLVRRFTLQHLVDMICHELIQFNLSTSSSDEQLYKNTQLGKLTSRLSFSANQELDEGEPYRAANTYKAVEGGMSWPTTYNSPEPKTIAYPQSKRSASKLSYLRRYALSEAGVPIKFVLQPVCEQLINQWGVAGTEKVLQHMQKKLTADSILAGRYGLENLTVLHETLQQFSNPGIIRIDSMKQDEKSNMILLPQPLNLAPHLYG